MNKKPDQDESLRLLEHCALGRLSAGQAEELARRFKGDPALRRLWAEYQVSRSLDGQLAPAEESQLAGKLQGDPLLRKTRDQYARLDAEMGELAAETFEWNLDSQREEILTAVKQRRLRRLVFSRWWRSARVVLAAAAVFVLLFGAVLLFRPASTDPGQEFRVSVLPGLTAPAPEGNVVVTLLPAPETHALHRPAGAVLVATGAPGTEPSAQGMSMYMMLARGFGTEFPWDVRFMDIDEAVAMLCTPPSSAGNVEFPRQ